MDDATLHSQTLDKWSTVSILIGLILGAGIWFLSPTVAGDSEPFDRWGYYIPALCIAGLILGLVTGRAKVQGAAAIGAGQILFAVIFLQPLSGLFIVGVAFILACSALCIPLAIAGAKLRSIVERHENRPA